MLIKNNIKAFITGFLIGGILLISCSGTAKSVSKTITAVYNNIKIYVDGKLIEPKDANGNAIEPFIYNGTTYSSDNNKLYKMKTDGTNKTKVCDDVASYINVKSGWIYYFNESDMNDIYYGGKLYKIKIDGTERTN